VGSKFETVLWRLYENALLIIKPTNNKERKANHETKPKRSAAYKEGEYGSISEIPV
jgi:hypothetical protein